MKIDQACPAFRPVTIIIETQDEFDKLTSVIDNVACNRVQHAPQIINAAKELRTLLTQVNI